MTQVTPYNNGRHWRWKKLQALLFTPSLHSADLEDLPLLRPVSPAGIWQWGRMRPSSTPCSTEQGLGGGGMRGAGSEGRQSGAQNASPRPLSPPLQDACGSSNSDAGLDLPLGEIWRMLNQFFFFSFNWYSFSLTKKVPDCGFRSGFLGWGPHSPRDLPTEAV